VGRLIIRLIEPSEGEILFEGENLARLDKKTLQGLRRSFQIIFQDPFASLNPRMTVSEIVGLPMEIHGLTRRSERDEKVGLPKPGAAAGSSWAATPTSFPAASASASDRPGPVHAACWSARRAHPPSMCPCRRRFST
jgi:ABC-type dipeptide/oligopeptide/nickel transport system ATPase component